MLSFREASAPAEVGRQVPQHAVEQVRVVVDAELVRDREQQRVGRRDRLVLGVLIASAVVDTSDFGAQEAWFYITLLTIGYLVSRGLAKSGSRDFYDDYADGDNR